MAQAHLTQERIRWAWIFIGPMLVMLFLVAFWPLARTIFYSFTDATLNDMSQSSFIGLSNYFGKYGVLRDSLWWRSISVTLIFTVCTVALETLFGMVIALVMHQQFFGRTLLRTAVLIPWAIPTVVSAKLWGWMLNDQYGIINDMLIKLGVISTGIAWTGLPEYSLPAIIMVDVWKTTPFMALLILAALQLVPGDMYEAAKVDGVSRWKQFWALTLPLIRPAVVVAMIFRTMDALRVFELIYVLTSNSDDVMAMSGYAQKTLVDYQEVGLGSAASTLVFFLVALVAGLYLTIGKVKLEEGGK